MAAATAINPAAFTNRDMAENNSASCLNANGLEPSNMWRGLHNLPVALDEQLIPFAQLLRPLRELLSPPASHMKTHLCSKSAFDVCKHACSARASSSLTSKESAPPRSIGH